MKIIEMFKSKVKPLNKKFNLNYRVDDADRYHGATAQNYLDKRINQKRWKIEQSIIENLIMQEKEGCTILDVPFGTGRFVNYYIKKQMHVFGVDISKDMITAAEKILGETVDKCNISIGSAEKLPHEANTFDIVLSARFFSHLSYTMSKNVLAEFNRVTKPKGKVILSISVHNKKQCFSTSKIKQLIKSLIIGKPLWKIKPSGNISEKQLTVLLKRYGFEVVDSIFVDQKKHNSYCYYVLQKTEVPLC